MKNYKAFWPYLRPYRATLVWIVVLTLAQMFMDLYMPTLLANIVNDGILPKNMTYIYQQGGLMLLASAANLGLSLYTMMLIARFALGIGRDLRLALFKKIQTFSLQDMQRFGTSSYITRTTSDVQQLAQISAMLLRMGLLAPTMFIGSLILSLRLNVQLSLVMVISVPLLIVAIGLLMIKATPLFEKMRQLTDDTTRITHENLTGVRVIRAFNKDTFENERFDHVNREQLSVRIRFSRLVAITQPLMIFMINSSSLALMWFGAHLIQAGNLSVGTLIAMTQYAMLVLIALMLFSMVIIMFPQAEVAAQRINDVLLQQPVVSFDEGHEILAPIKQLSFEHVSFCYPKAEKQMLHNVSFTAQTGDKIAIIGSTGAGKSTLMNLLLRFLDATEGRVLYNNQDVRSFSEHSLRQQIAFVPQNRNLFAGTIADNLRFGNPEASQEQMIEALKQAEAWEFVSQLDDQLHARVDQGGDNFSGGQKQRLAIARALIRPASLFVFDDSFSALDFKTEAKLRHNLRQLNQQAIVVVVAQRISSVTDATKIVVLNEGVVVGIGTHDELSAHNTVYQEIVASQSRSDANTLEEGGQHA